MLYQVHEGVCAVCSAERETLSALHTAHTFRNYDSASKAHKLVQKHPRTQGLLIKLRFPTKKVKQSLYRPGQALRVAGV